MQWVKRQKATLPERVAERRFACPTFAHNANNRLVMGQVLDTFKNKLAKRVRKRRERLFKGLKAIRFIHTVVSA
ncbi:hypothetical protein KPRYC492_22610 [Klebsiella pneumoniae RYC492]|nr:hypothetical protein KPRYC492_22610 [Klebsiella pneumoniae RYC492]